MNSPKTISGQSHNDFGTGGGQGVPLSRISIDTGFRDSPRPSESGPVLPSHPLDAQEVLRICLSDAASKALEALGPHVLVIATPADATAPESMRGRYVLHAMPTTPERANAAYRAAQGLPPAKAPRGRAKSPSRPTTTPSVVPNFRVR